MSRCIAEVFSQSVGGFSQYGFVFRGCDGLLGFKLICGELLDSDNRIVAKMDALKAEWSDVMESVAAALASPVGNVVKVADPDYRAEPYFTSMSDNTIEHGFSFYEKDSDDGAAFDMFLGRGPVTGKIEDEIEADFARWLPVATMISEVLGRLRPLAARG